jgi:hypothetical protein
MELSVMLGKVTEVFMPNDDFNMIGFKIQIDDDVIEIVQKQSILNANIYKDDLVNVRYDEKNEYVIESFEDGK